MSVSSLSRMTVPLASDQSATGQGLLMPILQYRFRVVFENLGVSTPRTELTKQIMEAKRPAVKHQEVKIDVYNSTLYLAGKHEWDPFTCKLRDDASGSVDKLIGEQLQKQMDHMEQASASSGIDYKFITRFEMLDGGNGAHDVTVLETWELYGCWIQAADYGSMNYGSSEVATIDLTLRFDNVLQTPLGSGVGTDVGRTLGDNVTL